MNKAKRFHSTSVFSLEKNEEQWKIFNIRAEKIEIEEGPRWDLQHFSTKNTTKRTHMQMNQNKRTIFFFSISPNGKPNHELFFLPSLEFLSLELD